MPRSKTGITRKKLDAKALEAAVNAVKIDNISRHSAAEGYGVARRTLGRHLQKYENEAFKYKQNNDVHKVFSVDQESMLEQYLVLSSKMLYGLSRNETQKLAFNFAKANNLQYPSPWDKNEKAGKSWYYSFMSRHPGISLRKPQATSLSRATSFNRHNVSSFFVKYKNLLEKYQFSPENIYNVDESGITTVHNPTKVIAVKGVKQVGGMTSGERGVNTTVIACINAVGNSIPPSLIFPRVNFKDNMLKGAPPGTLGMANVSGWSNTENFLTFLNHFIKHTRPSQDNKVLLLMDNHESHVSIEAIDLAKKNGIVLFTFPPHTSHKLQPLDRGVFGPFKKFYNTAATNWLQSNPGKPITIYDLSEIVGTAYPRGFTPINIQGGFRAAGLWPFNENIFGDDEFFSASVTDRPLPHITAETESIPGPSRNEPSTSKAECIQTPEQLRPFPKAAPRVTTSRGRKCGKSRVLTETPEKLELEKEYEARQAKKAKVQKVTKKIIPESSSSEEEEDEMNLNDDSSDDVDWPTRVEEREVSHDVISPGEFWLTKLEGKKLTYYYIAEVVEIVDKDFKIKYLKKINQSTNKFLHESEKIFSITNEDFVMKLPAPTSVGGSARREMQLAFSVDLSSYKVK